jgi:hypothetical protein
MHVTKFVDYSAQELRAAGELFVTALNAQRDLINQGGCMTRSWTELVLDFFAETASQWVRVDASAPHASLGVERPVASLFPMLPKRRTSGEFMLDMCHTTWLRDEDLPDSDYWKESLKRQPKMRLALESENGSRRRGRANIEAVMLDAAKLLHIASDTKVMVFASRNVRERTEILDLARRMVTADQSTSADRTMSWLWVDLPWETWTANHGAGAWLVKEDGAEAVQGSA